MGIKNFFDKTVVVRRLKVISGNRKALRATATADCALQELDAQEKMERGIVASRSWIAYFDIEQDLKEGDSITDGSGVMYKVKEITKKDYGINQHLEVMIEEYNA
jgi:hypothetical protein